MSIIRTHKHRRFSVLDNEPIQDMRLSWEALGVLSYLLSKPDDWEIIVGHLIGLDRGAKRDKVYRMLKELEDAGYLARIREHRPDGTFQWVRELYESPAFNPHLCAEEDPRPAFPEMAAEASPLPGKPDMAPLSPLPAFPYTAEPDTAEPHTVKPTLVNTDLAITEGAKTEGERTEGEEAPFPSPLPASSDETAFDELLAALASVVGWTLKLLKPKKQEELRAAAAQLSDAGYGVADLRAFAEIWEGPDNPLGLTRQRGKVGKPWPSQVLQYIDLGRQLAHREPWRFEEDAGAVDDAAAVEPALPPVPAPAPADSQAAQWWDRVKGELHFGVIAPAVFDQYLRNTHGLALDETGQLEVVVPSAQVKEFLEMRLNGALVRRLGRIAGQELSLHFVTKEEANAPHCH